MAWKRPEPKMSDDTALVTAEAILFRIERIKQEAGSILNPAQARRIAALRARLPKDPNAPVAPAFNAALLVSKKDVDEHCNAMLVIA